MLQLALLPIVFLAYVFKASTGFGSAIVMVALGSLVVGPVEAVTMVALLDIVGGATLLRMDATKDTPRLWIPLAAAMVVGAVTGGVLLSKIPVASFGPLLGVSVVAVGLWMVFLRGRRGASVATEPLPDSASPADVAACLVAGLCGGLTGLSGPPLVLYFGRRLVKEAFRRILTRVFLAEAIARVATYTAVDVLEPGILLTAGLAIPVLFLGLYTGNHVFNRVPEVWFGRLAGGVIIASGIRMLV